MTITKQGGKGASEAAERALEPAESASEPAGRTSTET